MDQLPQAPATAALATRYQGTSIVTWGQSRGVGDDAHPPPRSPTRPHRDGAWSQYMITYCPASDTRSSTTTTPVMQRLRRTRGGGGPMGLGVSQLGLAGLALG